MLKKLLLIFLLFLPLNVEATTIPNSFDFANNLATEGDYYRAITEYKRFIFQNPESPRVPQARLSIATSLIAGKRWEQADSSFENLFILHPQTPESAKGHLLYADSAYARGAYGLARERYRTLLQLDIDSETTDYSNFRIGWTFLEQDKPLKARSSFSLLPQQQQILLAEDLDGYLGLKLKSPKLAGTLSALMPGAGQLYTERPRQAAISFLLNGAFILGSIEAFNNENYAVGGILLFFELGWYGGNIFNAVNNAHKYNHRAKHDYRQQMRSRLNLRLGMLKRTPLVSMQFRF